MATIKLINTDSSINSNVTSYVSNPQGVPLPRLIQDSGNNYRFDHREGDTYVYIQSAF